MHNPFRQLHRNDRNKVKLNILFAAANCQNCAETNLISILLLCIVIYTAKSVEVHNPNKHAHPIIFYIILKDIKDFKSINVDLFIGRHTCAVKKATSTMRCMPIVFILWKWNVSFLKVRCELSQNRAGIIWIHIAGSYHLTCYVVIRCETSH